MKFVELTTQFYLFLELLLIYLKEQKKTNKKTPA